MATFKVGDKARIVNVVYEPHTRYNGAEVTILGALGANPLYPNSYEISPLFSDPFTVFWFAEPQYLAPLTDPKADAFIESIKRLEREPKPVPLPEVLSSSTSQETPLKVLKVMFKDGRIVGYVSKNPDVVAAQMIEMTADEFAAQLADPDKPDVQTIFRNEGHRMLRA